MMVILKMLQSVTLLWVAGAIGGPMGMIGHKVDLSPITSASSMTDILMDGRKEELLCIGRNEAKVVLDLKS
jgi:hypothetical protein